MPRILVTGAAGYIGSHVVIQLLTEGYDVLAVDDFSRSNAANWSRVEELIRFLKPLGRCEFCRKDIGDRSGMEAIIQFGSVDSVVHLAGKKIVPESIQFPAHYHQSIVTNSYNLLETCKSKGIKHFVYSSSASVYGDPIYLPIDEAHPLMPKSPYAQAKAEVELMLERAVSCGQLDTARVLRYFNPVGCHESAMIGELAFSKMNMSLISNVLSVVLGDREQLLIYGIDHQTVDGSGVRDFIHVSDLASAHTAVVAKTELMQSNRFEVFNVGTGHGTTILELISAFERVVGIKVPRRIVGRRAGDVSRSFASCERGNSVLGWRAMRSIEQMCASAWAFASANGYLLK